MMRMVRNLQLGAGTDVAAKANPLLSKEGQARSAGVVCSEMRSHVIDAREAPLINRYCSSLNSYYCFALSGSRSASPHPSLCEGIPALLRRGMALTPFGQQPRKPVGRVSLRTENLRGSR